MNKSDTVNFKIQTVELLEKSFIRRQVDENQLFKYDIALEQLIDVENKKILVNTTVTIAELVNEESPLAKLSIGCGFYIDNFDDFFDRENQVANFPEIFVITINSISISTLRGIMFSELSGTYLHNAILPIFDPKALIIKAPK